jgi:hypothetical protein
MERKAALRKFLRACVNIDVLDLEIVGRKPTGSGSDIGDLLSVLIQDLAGLRTYLVAIWMTVDDIGEDFDHVEAGFKVALDSVDGITQGFDGIATVMDRLTAENQTQAERIAELEARIVELEAAQKAKPAAATVSDTGEEYVPWIEFEAAAMKAFGREGSWKSVAAFEMDMDVKVLNAWQTVGVIPARYVAMVQALTDDQKAPASRKSWSDDDYARLQALVDKGKRNREIAKILSREFGRRLIETSITGARRRSRDR